jgi:hypothetical protein
MESRFLVRTPGSSGSNPITRTHVSGNLSGEDEYTREEQKQLALQLQVCVSVCQGVCAVLNGCSLYAAHTRVCRKEGSCVCLIQ